MGSDFRIVFQESLCLCLSSLKSLFQLKNESFVFFKNPSTEEHFAVSMKYTYPTLLISLTHLKATKNIQAKMLLILTRQNDDKV